MGDWNSQLGKKQKDEYGMEYWEILDMANKMKEDGDY